MNIEDKLIAKTTMYISFPEKRKVLTENSIYEVLRLTGKTFVIVDDLGNEQEFFLNDPNSTFLNMSNDVRDFIKQLETCIKLNNKQLPICTFDYLIKQHKSFKYKTIKREFVPNEQLTILTIDWLNIDANKPVIEVLELLKELQNEHF